MVASINGDSNLGMLYWAVFKWTGSEWQFLMKQRHAAILMAVGSDIRETWSIYLPNDSRCCPSGGTKARIWHWNGRFVAGPWKPSAKDTPGMAAFFTPSRNLFCTMADHGADRAGVHCSSSHPEHTVSMGLGGRLHVCRGPGCIGNPGESDPQPTPRLLGYGRQLTLGRFRCRSEATGVTCVVIRTGKGFVINRDGVSQSDPDSRVEGGVQRRWSWVRMGMAAVAAVAAPSACGNSGRRRPRARRGHGDRPRADRLQVRQRGCRESPRQDCDCPRRGEREREPHSEHRLALTSSLAAAPTGSARQRSSLLNVRVRVRVRGTRVAPRPGRNLAPHFGRNLERVVEIVAALVLEARDCD